jgi:uncharacterized membrane protein
MELITIARIIHVMVVILWIGGVGMVTTVILPAVKRMKSKEEQIETFEKIEGRFASQAKILTLITVLSGAYMLFDLNAWERYLDYRFWWIHLMTLVWLAFTIVLFVLEPLVLHKLFRKHAQKNPDWTFKIIQRFHWILLVLSLIATFGAVAGSHGLHFFK